MNSKFRNIFLVFGVVAVVIMLFTFDVSYDDLLNNLRRAGFYLPLVLLLWLFIYLINTLSWYIILRSGGKTSPLGFMQLYKFTVSGFALNYVTPVGLMGGEPYRIMELTPFVGMERATSSVILYVMMHIFSHFLLWLSSVFIYVCVYPVSWEMGIVLGLITALCLFLGTLFVKGYRHGMAVACVRMGSHIPFLKHRVIRFSETHKEKLENIDKHFASSAEKEYFLQCFVFGIFGENRQLSGSMAHSECADYKCQFCKLHPHRGFFFLAGQFAVFPSHAVGRARRWFCFGSGRTFPIGSLWCVCGTYHTGT